MKNKLTWLSILCVLLLLPSQTLHANENMKAVLLTEQQLKISFPEGFYVLQQEVSEDDPYLALIGASKKQVEEYYKENNIYVHGIAPDKSYEIICTIKPNDSQQYLTDLSLLSEEDINALASNMADIYTSYGYNVISSGGYEANNESFVVIRFDTTDGDKKVCCKQYYSFLNDKAYYFTLRVYADSISSEIEAVMNDISNSIYFFRVTNRSSLYENDTYGIKFRIPEGWEEKKINKVNEYLQAQFVQTNMLGETFLLYTYDVWSDLDIVHKIMTTRDDLDTTSGMEAVVKNQAYYSNFFTDISKVENRKSGDATLIWEEEPMLLEHDQVQGNYYQQNYCMMRRGILYVFQYGYYEGNDLHKDEVIKILDSITLSEPEILDKDSAAYEEIAAFTNKVLAVCVITIVIIGLLIFLYIKNKKEDSEE